MIEDIPPIKHGDFPASHVSFGECRCLDPKKKTAA